MQLLFKLAASFGSALGYNLADAVHVEFSLTVVGVDTVFFLLHIGNLCTAKTGDMVGCQHR